MKTRQQLGEKATLPPYSVFSFVMNEVANKKEDVKNVGFHSDVYYVRAALEAKSGYLFPLFVVEQVMREQGWNK